MPSLITCDLAIVGGGLAGGLLALALRARHPALDMRVIDGGGSIGGNHLWSFNTGDVAPTDRGLVAPLVAHDWAAYDVAFPALRRTLPSGYHTITSERLDAAVRRALTPQGLMLNRRALAVSATAVVLADGDRVEAKGVIDARGPADLGALELGWQTFLGRELLLGADHGRDRPVIMDASVAQLDGYRFVYCLPFGPTRMFVEDTYYADTPGIDAPALRTRIDAYAAAQGWQVSGVGREEAGALPVAMGGDFDAYWLGGGKGVPKAGMRAGLFHPLTGYSLPDAVRTASLVAGLSDFSGAALHEVLRGHARRTWAERRFYRLLSAMLFRAAEPAERYRILQRFYKLDEGLIARFYAGRSTLADKVRVLSGKPPVPIGRALRAIAPSRLRTAT